MQKLLIALLAAGGIGLISSNASAQCGGGYYHSSPQVYRSYRPVNQFRFSYGTPIYNSPYRHYYQPAYRPVYNYGYRGGYGYGPGRNYYGGGRSGISFSIGF